MCVTIYHHEALSLCEKGSDMSYFVKGHTSEWNTFNIAASSSVHYIHEAVIPNRILLFSLICGEDYIQRDNITT